MNVAIVGSRTFPQLKLVEWFIQDLPAGVTIISGGAQGVDTAAATYARQRGLPSQEFLPDLRGCRSRVESTQRYYARNQRIAEAADLLVAFTEKDSGGTWDTLKRASAAGKPIKVIRPMAFFPGETDRDTPREAADSLFNPPPELPAPEPSGPKHSRQAKGRGPFQLRYASLGSYALRRKCYIRPEEWAAIVAQKDHDPAALASRIAPDMVSYFAQNRRFGIAHAVTVCPRSIRHLQRVHPMDLVAQQVAESLGCPFVRMFQPWEKTTRGRHAQPGELEITPEVAPYVGKVVWILDDVYTTGRTLRAAVQGLFSLEIHAHGLVWVYLA